MLFALDQADLRLLRGQWRSGQKNRGCFYKHHSGQTLRRIHHLTVNGNDAEEQQLTLATRCGDEGPDLAVAGATFVWGATLRFRYAKRHQYLKHSLPSSPQLSISTQSHHSQIEDIARASL